MNRREALKAVLGIAAVAATGGLALAVKPRELVYGRHMAYMNFLSPDAHRYAMAEPKFLAPSADFGPFRHAVIYDDNGPIATTDMQGEFHRYEGFSRIDIGADGLARLS